MEKKRLKPKWYNIIPSSVILICLISLFITVNDIVKWNLDANDTKQQVEEIQEITEIVEVKETEKVEIIEQIEEIPKSNPYWDYIKMNLINVNFNELKKINPNTKGWVQVNGTNINYPFVQGKDNKYYLTHSFDKSYNKAGWIFLDYRNNIDLLSKNTILYAHSRLDLTMFGSLKKTLTNEWLNNTNNHVIRLSTEKENSLWQVFSIYHIPVTNDYIITDFNTDEEFKYWSSMIINRSIYDFNTTVNNNDNILTLSTCYNDNERVVLHAKLIKKETR